MNAADRWSKTVPPYAVFIDVSTSESVVQSGIAPTSTLLDGSGVSPLAWIVKFGGDWGGLWGGPPQWGNLSPKAANPPKVPIIPMIYVTPGHTSQYSQIVGGLLSLGYPAIILDAEMDWIGHEAELGNLIDALVPASNLIGVSGFAWFGGWPDRGQAVGQALNNKDVVYLPQAYRGAGWDWTSAGYQSFPAGVAAELSRVVPNLPKAWTFDNLAVDAGDVQWLLPTLAPTYWYRGTLTAARYKLLQVPLEQGEPGGGGIVGGDLAALNGLIESLRGDLYNAKVHFEAINKMIGGPT